MNTHWTDRLSDYLDGHLEEDELRDAEEHLATCSECRAVLEDFKAVVVQARRLQDREPEQDLWSTIAAGIGVSGEGAGDTIRLDEHRRAKQQPRQAFVRLSMPQLAAASLVLMMASGGGAWFLRPAATGQPSAATLAPSGVEMVSMTAQPGSPYSEEVARLEAALAQLGDVLAPSTVRVIQKNLVIIDQAIEESTTALQNDPNDEFLKDYLAQTFRRKVEYLRETAAIVGAEI